ncbi:MAG: NADH:flavin oxidoreductase [Pseudomonadales bacterium]|nr:NADH:flavin oxidoreductase [Pseudomonadales bacterium]
MSAATALEGCFSEGRLNGLTLKNRFIKAGTFEGMTPGGEPSSLLEQFHCRLADGGIAMTTIGYCAVEPDGRLHENMMYMHDGIHLALAGLVASIQARGAKVSGQMGHGGGFSKNRDLRRRRPLGASFGVNGLGVGRGMFFCDAMSLADIDDLVKAYFDAAVLMKSVGFDALEIHFGHGYGLCQFMSPKTNKRHDQYGGTLQNRMRLPLRVLAAVRDAVGTDFPILGKISLTEGVKGGLQYEDAVAIAKMLDVAGIDGIVTSGGTSTMNPMIMFRGDSFLKPMIRAEKNWLMKAILSLYGPAMFRDYPYEEMYFLDQASRVRDAVNCKVIYIGGASSNASFAHLVSRGFDFIQLGRALLSDPDLPNKAKVNGHFGSRCNHCNECVATIEHPKGIHCTRFS